jgi:hypothetical protein
VGHENEDAQDLAIGNLCRIEGDLDRFGVAGRASAYQFIDGSRLIAAGVAGLDLLDTFDMLENTLNCPEATAGEDGDPHLAGRHRLINCRRRPEGRVIAGAGRHLRERDKDEASENHRTLY